MTLYKEIMRIVEEESRISAPIRGKSNLYYDYAFDSLSFMSLLLRIEETYSITFGIAEIEQCIELEKLIALVELKRKEQADIDKEMDMQPDQ